MGNLTSLYTFLKISYVDAVMIGSQLNLILPDDAYLSDLDRRKVIFQRAQNNNQLDELDTLVQRIISKSK